MDKLFYHKPVLVNEVLHYLDPQPEKIYLDVTFGTGGHTKAILEREPRCKVIALDWDSVSLEKYGQPLVERFPSRLKLVWGNFALLYKIIKKEKIVAVDGILADFGTSQIQIKERPGFSVYADTILDMRMSPAHQKITAAQVLQDSSEEKLREIFWQLGEENHARQIARAIVLGRKKKKIKTTRQLADLIERVVPKNRKQKIHPATRVFQALRIYVNKELENITSFLSSACKVLTPSGRLVCISFHSLEDRIVKRFFKEKSNEGILKVLTETVILASDQEVKINPSARSAKLRAAERL